jgi:rubrerythrin
MPKMSHGLGVNNMGYDKNNPRNKKRDKKWKSREQHSNSYHNNHSDMDDAELLRIQGLLRCKACDGVFPIGQKECPMCHKK